MKQNDYKKIYLQESDELLQQMNQGLLVFEKNQKDEGALNSIFRSAHTLKSMSASMGYQPIADLSHKMEDVLVQLRDGTVEANENIIDLLFKSFDSLEKMVSSVQEEKEIDLKVEPLIASLDAIMIKEFHFSEEKISADLSLNQFEKKTLARVKKDGYTCYDIRITLNKNCVLKAVRAFMVFRNLHAIGEVIKSIPDSQSLEEEKFDLEFSCIFVSKENETKVKDSVMEILEIDKADVKEIDIDAMWDQEIASGSAAPDSSYETGRAPGEMRKIRSVRVDIERLDKLMNLVEELAINKLRLAEISLRVKDVDLKGMIEGMSRLTDNLQNEVMQARLVPVGQVFDRFPRMARDLAKKQGKRIRFDMIGNDIELDRTVLDEIGDPIIHLIRNAIDHGIESPDVREKRGKSPDGRVMLSAIREKNHVLIEVEDDGEGMSVVDIKKVALERGVASEEELRTMNEEAIYELTLRPGFSTSKNVTDVSGRGVGLDVVKEKSEALGGGVSVESKLGRGTKISMRLPITTAVVQALMVEALSRVFAISISSVVEIIVKEESDIKKIENRETILHRQNVLPIVRLDDLFNVSLRGDKVDEAISIGQLAKGDCHGLRPRNDNMNTKLNIVIVECGTRQFGIVVDKLRSQQDIVIKQLTKELKGIKGFSGATILGDASVALVLDVATLV